MKPKRKEFRPKEEKKEEANEVEKETKVETNNVTTEVAAKVKPEEVKDMDKETSLKKKEEEVMQSEKQVDLKVAEKENTTKVERKLEVPTIKITQHNEVLEVVAGGVRLSTSSVPIISVIPASGGAAARFNVVYRAEETVVNV